MHWRNLFTLVECLSHSWHIRRRSQQQTSSLAARLTFATATWLKRSVTVSKKSQKKLSLPLQCSRLNCIFFVCTICMCQRACVCVCRHSPCCHFSIHMLWIKITFSTFQLFSCLLIESFFYLPWRSFIHSTNGRASTFT